MNTTSDNYIGIFKGIDFNSIKDHPNILVAARFWEHERYCAAKVCYRFMRSIDDMIDDYKAKNKIIAPGERNTFTTNVNDWLRMIVVSSECNPDQKELIDTVDKFSIPLWPLEDFARSMIWDINNDGFPTLDSFIEYSKGASVAPASIFVHLNGLTEKDGIYQPPPFDVREAATPCAMFSYLVHIIRDFQKDQLNNLNYFADDLISKHSLSRHDLREIAYGHPFGSDFRNMIEEYYQLADAYRIRTLEMIGSIRHFHEPRYRLSLEIIFSLYTMVFERINISTGTFTSKELNPTPEETRERVFRTIMNFIP
jgi:phytoene/squalene synthetase